MASGKPTGPLAPNPAPLNRKPHGKHAPSAKALAAAPRLPNAAPANRKPKGKHTPSAKALAAAPRTPNQAPANVGRRKSK